MAKPKISEDAAIEAAIDAALSAGRIITITGIDPSMSGRIGVGKIDVNPRSRTAPFSASRAGAAAGVFVPEVWASEPAADPGPLAEKVLSASAASGFHLIACEEQYIGRGPAAAMKVVAARARLLYAFELRLSRYPHILVMSNPQTWHSRVLGPKRWTRDLVKPAAARFATNLALQKVEGDAADALGIAAHQLGRFFAVDLGALR